MGKRIGRWLAFMFFGASMPMVLCWLMHWHAHKLPQCLSDLPAAIWFSVAITAAALADLSANELARGEDIKRIFSYILTFGLVLACTLYVLFVYDSLVKPKDAAARVELVEVGIWVAIVYALFSTLMQYLFVAENKEEPPAQLAQPQPAKEIS